jgi:hypothetical protein
MARAVRKQVAEQAKGIWPPLARPPRCPRRSCSAMPTLTNDPEAAAKSAQLLELTESCTAPRRENPARPGRQGIGKGLPAIGAAAAGWDRGSWEHLTFQFSQARANCSSLARRGARGVVAHEGNALPCGCGDEAGGRPAGRGAAKAASSASDRGRRPRPRPSRRPASGRPGAPWRWSPRWESPIAGGCGRR